MEMLLQLALVLFATLCQASQLTSTKRSPAVYTLFPQQSTSTSAESLVQPLPLQVLNAIVINPTKLVLNFVGDLLRISGEAADFPPAFALAQLLDEVDATGTNGLRATRAQQESIAGLVSLLERSSPTSRPAYSKLMAGSWELLYTDFDPPAGSSGKLGPFVGRVLQDLQPDSKQIFNILKISTPLRIDGELSAAVSILDDQTWQIEFRALKLSVLGLQVQNKPFPTREVRNWRISYLDKNLRIMRASRPEPGAKTFIFILRRV